MYVFFALALSVLAVFAIIIPFLFRKVVSTNKVDIVQYKNKTISYGAGQPAGNVYYKWPSWFPKIGVSSKELPVDNFDLNLRDYQSYDKDRVPFDVDIVAFFRIEETNVAANRISSYERLLEQLEYIVKGAARKILSSFDINQIMTDRATFGDKFTEEVKTELQNWGVVPVKNMELMDIRDSGNSKVIQNIMAKKSSHIEMESRIEVAKNHKDAETAEIEAERSIELARQEASEQIGIRKANIDKTIGISQQKSAQEIATEEALTKEKSMAVLRVEQIKKSEIQRDSKIIDAEKDKAVKILEADAALESTKRLSEGIKAKGEAEAAAEQAMQSAPVQAQIMLAKEIGENAAYQQYLVAIEAIKSYIQVGMEQSKALQNADVKVIANSGNANEGLNSATQILSPKGGLAIGGMLESLANTEQGAKLLDLIQDFCSKEKEGK